MIDKFVPDMTAALAGIADGSVVLLPGFGNGIPETLLQGLIAQGPRDLTLVANSGGRDTGYPDHRATHLPSAQLVPDAAAAGQRALDKALPQRLVEQLHSHLKPVRRQLLEQLGSGECVGRLQ